MGGSSFTPGFGKSYNYLFYYIFRTCKRWISLYKI